jgi:beta-glucosidase
MTGPAFPPGFSWGVGTSAYQIEGAATEDGRGPSIWDTFTAATGGGSGAVACDHYHRLDEDLDLIAALGVDTYRFSVAWPRVQPGGTGPANPAGLAFYDRLVDGLLERGVRPLVTLYHWDLPQELEDAGGWPVRETASRFADYAALVTGRLGDRVVAWSTLNEPWCSAFLGYHSGHHAPGRRDAAAALAAGHHLLLGHGLAAQAIRAAVPGAEVSIVLNVQPALPADPADEADVAAARRADGIAHRFFLDPVLRGAYPADVVEDTGWVSDWSFVRAGDPATIAAPLDRLGLNYYMTQTVTAADGADGPGSQFNPGLRGVRFLPPRPPLTEMGWNQDPAGLTAVLLRLAADYPGTPVMVTENGAAFADRVDPDGQVRDSDRIAYLDAHLRAVHAAIGAGADVRGYTVWSLLDNFEWADGYRKRFGLVRVDYPTQRRTVKSSGRWYADVVRARALPATHLREAS